MLKVGDKIRILEKSLDCAIVEVGDVLEVKHVVDLSFYTNSPRSDNGDDHGWVFSASHLGKGFEMYYGEKEFIEQPKTEEPKPVSESLTKREQFAMAAMQGILAKQGYMDPESAAGCVEIADYMLKELEK